MNVRIKIILATLLVIGTIFVVQMACSAACSVAELGLLGAASYEAQDQMDAAAEKQEGERRAERRAEREARREADAERLKAGQPKRDRDGETRQQRADRLCAPCDAEQVEALKLYIVQQHALGKSHADMFKAARQWCTERDILDGKYKVCLSALVTLELVPEG